MFNLAEQTSSKDMVDFGSVMQGILGPDCGANGEKTKQTPVISLIFARWRQRLERKSAIPDTARWALPCIS